MCVCSWEHLWLTVMECERQLLSLQTGMLGMRERERERGKTNMFVRKSYYKKRGGGGEREGGEGGGEREGGEGGRRR